ncbi:MAG: hypothetical protein JSV88_33585 [Candidatus Aminicenantes bacterium]|nr:MAG: hypothetical protein JSV88_33585 [Candidatus Aminicenantes bacterium]
MRRRIEVFLGINKSYFFSLFLLLIPSSAKKGNHKSQVTNYKIPMHWGKEVKYDSNTS